MKKFYKLLLLLLIHNYCSANPKIVVSITPIASIVSMLLGQEAEIISLANSNGCPHQHAAKLSDLNNIKNSDISIYIDKQFDHFAAKLMSEHAKEIIVIGDIDELKITYNNNVPNLHLWLDLSNVKCMLKQLSSIFIKQFPKLEQHITKNLNDSIIKIDNLAATKNNVLSNSSQVMLFSDSLEYFFNYNHNVIISNYSLSKNISYVNTFRDILEKNSHLKCFVFSAEQDTTFYNQYNKKIVKLQSENWQLSKDLSELYFIKYTEMIKLIEQCQ
ncbi:MAG: hypothetical protein EOP33_04100 [Rickettsiaceae bacterium]|nr:MAG: hypothetical protein EOP33_04100 [Rickettsiaceae bacterium]